MSNGSIAAGARTSRAPALGALPIATLGLALVAALLAVLPTTGGVLELRRDWFASLEWWRPVTGHVVHFGAAHALYDIALFAALGAWSEVVAPRRTRVLLAVAAVAVSLLVLPLDAGLERYRGLSALASCLFTSLALTLALDRARPLPTRAFAALGLAGLVAKVAFEFSGTTGSSGGVFAAGPYRVVPFAHVLGAACGLVAHFVRPQGQRVIAHQGGVA